MDETRELTPREQRFVAEYLIDLNSTQAAIRAGYAAKNADVQGPRLLGRVGIQQAIEAGKAKQLKKVDLKAERVLEELALIGFSRVGTLIKDGKLLPADQWPEEMQGVVSSVETVRRNMTSGDGATEEVIKLRLWDKVKALDTLAKHFGLVRETHDINVTIDVGERIRKAIEREREARQPRQLKAVNG